MRDELRPCYIGEKKGLFHRWIEESSVHRAVSRSDVSGIVNEVYGLVEMENGTMRKVRIGDIRFADDAFKGCVWIRS